MATFHAVAAGLVCASVALGSTLRAGQTPVPPSVPQLFAPDAISTGDFESHPAFADDGRTLYFLKSTLQFTWWTIVVSRYRSGVWTPPRIAPFSGR